jgi:hypothetical protein
MERAVQLDQRTAAPPFRGVEPSGRSNSSNRRAKSKKRLIFAIFLFERRSAAGGVVKNSDRGALD